MKIKFSRFGFKTVEQSGGARRRWRLPGWVSTTTSWGGWGRAWAWSPGSLGLLSPPSATPCQASWPTPRHRTPPTSPPTWPPPSAWLSPASSRWAPASRRRPPRPAQPPPPRLHQSPRQPRTAEYLQVRRWDSQYSYYILQSDYNVNYISVSQSM